MYTEVIIRPAMITDTEGAIDSVAKLDVEAVVTTTRTSTTGRRNSKTNTRIDCRSNTVPAPHL